VEQQLPRTKKEKLNELAFYRKTHENNTKEKKKSYGTTNEYSLTT
jgi:hypothetical protein